MSNLSDLKVRMEGKTVLRVEPPEAEEAICKFYMSDGSVFRLHATDLWFWVEDTKDSKDIYTSLDMMFRDYGHHVYHMGETSPTEVAIVRFLRSESALELVITAPSGRVFKCAIPEDSSAIALLRREDSIDRLREAAELGDMWRMAFNQ